MRKRWLVLSILSSLSPLFVVETAKAEEQKPPSMTLENAVKRALERNPQMEIAAAEIQRAEALSKQVRATWLPTLTANGTYTRLDNDRILNDRVALAKDQVTGNIQLNIPLIAPRQWVAWARSRDTVDLTHLSATDVRREIAVTTARTFLTVIGQHRVLASAERALKTARAHEDYATTRLTGGVGNRLDAVRAAQERATAETRVKVQTIALVRAEEALGVVVGENGPIDAVEDPVLAAPPSVQAALDEAGQKRADVIAQRERVEITRKSVRDSWTDYMPMLSAIGQPFYQNPATFTTPMTGWQAQLVLSIPIFDGGNRYGLREERSALHEQAKARLDGALRTARSEVRVAFETLRRSDEALVEAREAASLARQALELAELAYSAGATSNIEVVDAERRSQDADIAAAVAEDASRQARLDLLAACGRFPNP